LAGFFALLTGTCELLFVTLHRYVLGHITYVSPHIVWMAPAANLVVFALAGLLLLGFSERWPGVAGVRVSATVFGMLSAFSIALALPFKLHIAAALVLAGGVGVQAGRWLGGSGAIPHWIRRATAILALGLAVTTAGVVGRRPFVERAALSDLPAAPEGAPNVLLLILDTVRAKSLGLYGYERATTPHLSAFARNGLVFERAVATAPWTLPSHASVFTGRFPHQLSADWEEPLDDAHATLAEVLGSSGYQTAGFVANLLYGSYVHGLSRGFVHYEDYPVSVGQTVLSSSLGRALAGTTTFHRLLGYEDLLNRKPAGVIVDAFLDWIDGREERPYFAFLNLFDAHEPYLPPPPFDTLFGPTGPRPLSREVSLKRDTRARRPAKWIMTPEEFQIELNAYDGAIAYLDSELGRLFETLEARGELDNTLVVVTSDHGEQHGEHRLFGHLNSLYAPLLHVPLLIAGPGVPVGRLEGTVSLRDLPATILDLVSAPDERRLPGHSLAPLWATDSAPLESDPPIAGLTGATPPGPILSTLYRGVVLRPWYPVLRGDEMHSLWDGDYHYICNGDGFEEVYDTSLDQEEEDNLADGQNGPSLAPRRDELTAALGRPHACSPPRTSSAFSKK
jgi:arylsulfatase A-like enzyme